MPQYNRSSELRCRLPLEVFEKIYSNFMNQADINAISQKANGAKVPMGIAYSTDDYTIDNGKFLQHFGQGTASQTPYISWHVVSIYYIVPSARVVLGIEEDRYPKVTQMSPYSFERIGRKKTDIAVFYEGSKENLNYKELYEKFICVSEEVMALGMQ